MARGISIHVGVNNVDPAVYGSPLSLRGCENDARSMKAIAQAAGLDTSPALMLSSAATAQNVTTAIRGAAASLGSEDILFLTYSGHGGQVPNPLEEGDQLNETWVLYDRQLIDDELSALWTEFATGTRIFVLSDSCHSGTVVKDIATGLLWDGTRQATLNSLPQLARDLVGLDSAPPATKELPFQVQEQVYYRDKAIYDALPREADPAIGASVVLISGCQDNQVSLDGAVNGLFTEKLLTAWGNGAFSGGHLAFRNAIGSLLPPTQSPNYFTTGTPSPAFEAQRPLTIESPVPRTVYFWDKWPQVALNPWKEKGMSVPTTSAAPAPGQEKWITSVISAGMQVFQALTKEGYQLQDGNGQAIAATKDADTEKWFQFLPLAISVGAEVYDALSKEGVLPANKQVALPKDSSPDSQKAWYDAFVPIALQIGTQVVTALTKDGYVSAASLPQDPKLSAPANKSWLDFIPVVIDIGTQVYEAATKAAVPMPDATKSIIAGAATGTASKEAVPKFSELVVKAGSG